MFLFLFCGNKSESKQICFTSHSNDTINNGILKQINGKWYMGTMTGFDCNLEIGYNQLFITTGGCFHTDSTLTDTLIISENKIMLTNPKIIKRLGNKLFIKSYKKNLILFPETTFSLSDSTNYSYHICFWKNLMENGLQLAKESEDFKN